MTPPAMPLHLLTTAEYARLKKAADLVLNSSDHRQPKKERPPLSAKQQFFRAVIRAVQNIEGNPQRWIASVRGAKWNPATLVWVDDPASQFTSEIGGDMYAKPAYFSLDMMNSPTVGGILGAGDDPADYPNVTLTPKAIRLDISVLVTISSDGEGGSIWTIDTMNAIKALCNQGGGGVG